MANSCSSRSSRADRVGSMGFAARLRRWTARGAAALATVAVIATLGFVGASPARALAPASAPAEFDPGLIVSDYNFFNAYALNESEIQEFLEAQPCQPSEDSVPCLAIFRQNTVTQLDQGFGHCDSYEGGRSERASRIIAKVAVACGISPQVLLVLLQKEQSLLTRPDSRGYLRATGYGCPDTADCDTQYFGFFNQLYNAAWQFRQYTEEPERQFHVGDVRVAYNPDAACGATTVAIQNQATANLYNYTPYQPNQAAVRDALSDRDGDACSAHGNLNFWIFWTQWFGDPTTQPWPDYVAPCLNLVGGQPCRAVYLTVPGSGSPT